MDAHIPRNLWIDRQEGRYFLIPDEAEFPAGNFRLVSLDGEERSVLSTAVAPFEVAEEQAREHISVHLQAAVDQIKEWVENFRSGKGKGRSRQKRAGQDELVNLLQVFRDLLTGLEQNDRSHVKAARTKLRRLRRMARAQGVELDPGIEQLPELLYEWYGSAHDEASVEELGLMLVEIVGHPAADRPSGERIDEAIQELEKSFGGALSTEERERARQEQARQTEEAIKSALQARGYRPPTIDDLWPQEESGEEDKQ